VAGGRTVELRGSGYPRARRREWVRQLAAGTCSYSAHRLAWLLLLQPRARCHRSTHTASTRHSPKVHPHSHPYPHTTPHTLLIHPVTLCNPPQSQNLHHSHPITQISHLHLSSTQTTTTMPMLRLHHKARATVHPHSLSQSLQKDAHPLRQKTRRQRTLCYYNNRTRTSRSTSRLTRLSASSNASGSSRTVQTSSTSPCTMPASFFWPAIPPHDSATDPCLPVSCRLYVGQAMPQLLDEHLREAPVQDAVTYIMPLLFQLADEAGPCSRLLASLQLLPL